MISIHFKEKPCCQAVPKVNAHTFTGQDDRLSSVCSYISLFVGRGQGISNQDALGLLSLAKFNIVLIATGEKETSVHAVDAFYGATKMVGLVLDQYLG